MLSKTGFSRHFPQGGTPERQPGGQRRTRPGNAGIWEHLIRDEGDFVRHVDYIHFNPVKHGQVTRAADWPYSSIHRYIEAGMMDHDLSGGICGNDKSGYGERE
jgi:putative transposase